MKYNFTIRISQGGEQLNLIQYAYVELESFSSVNRIEMFKDTFYSMETETVGSISGNGRRKCNDWDFIEFKFSEEDSPLNSVSFTKSQVEVELNSTQFTIEQFIESNYLLLIQNLNI